VAPGPTPAPTSTQSSPGAAFSTGASAAVSGAAAGLAGVANSVTSAWNSRSANKPEKQPKQKSAKVRRSSKRQAMLTLSRVEPWSVMKFSFLASVVAFIILFVAVAVLYMVLSLLGVFDSLQHTVSTLTSSKNAVGTNISHYYSASLILGYTAMLGALNIVLITAMSTVGSVIYNLIAKTVGGIEVTLRETD
jgi:cell division protein FtsL